MCRKLPVLVLAATSLAAAGAVGTLGAAGRPRPASIEGVWRTVEVTSTGPGAMRASGPPSLGIFTAKHYSRVEIHGEEPRPSLPDVARATAEQLRATWGPFFAEAGTYELSGGDVLTMRPLVAKNPAAMSSGWFVVYTYRLESDTLRLTEQRNQRGPIASLHTITLARVE
jgi:hypothetical protein